MKGRNGRAIIINMPKGNIKAILHPILVHKLAAYLMMLQGATMDKYFLLTCTCIGYDGLRHIICSVLPMDT